TLIGSVTDENGHPIPGAEVSIVQLQSDEEYDGGANTDQMIVQHPGSDASHTGADGTFHLTLRASGALDVSVDAEGFRRATGRAVEVGLGDGGKMPVDGWASPDIRSQSNYQAEGREGGGPDTVVLTDNVVVNGDEDNQPAMSGYPAVVYLESASKSPIQNID